MVKIMKNSANNEGNGNNNEDNNEEPPGWINDETKCFDRYDKEIERFNSLHHSETIRI